MKKVLFINGSPNENGCVSIAMDEVITVLNDNGIQTEKIWLGKKAMPDCMACMKCQETGKCVFQDQVNEIASEIDEIGGIIVGSPVYYGGPNGRLTSFLDRLFSAFQMINLTENSAHPSFPAGGAVPAQLLSGLINIF